LYLDVLLMNGSLRPLMDQHCCHLSLLPPFGSEVLGEEFPEVPPQ
jgi:hypothetical protein